MLRFRPISLTFRSIPSLHHTLLRSNVNFTNLKYESQLSRIGSRELNLRTFVSSKCVNESQVKDSNESVIDYRELKPLTLTPSDDVLLVDVREVEEVIQGNIPSSVNLPLSSIEKSLELHSDEFIKLNGFRKPSLNQKIIFYCRSGKRSQTALEISKLKGFKNVKNYKGSWVSFPFSS
ncbi:Rhodanese-like domain-containing protein [Melampsora americana]|nr:Rhodanese-like domain-containing protein [Melampsora americana]